MNILIYLYIHIYEYISIWFVGDFTKLNGDFICYK